MSEDRIERAVSTAVFGAIRALRSVWERLDLPVISTGRSFAHYRKIFFDDRPEAEVLAELRGKRIVDVGCGLTPYVSDSMFQTCRRAGVELFGVDPKLAKGFRLGRLDRAKISLVGGGSMIADAPGLGRAIGAYADALPFEDESVDLILSAYALYAWIDDESVLAKTFAEFRRVLKPGGEVRIFPAPYHEPRDIRSPELLRVIQDFRVRQKFHVALAHSLGVLPSHMRTMIKVAPTGGGTPS